MIIFTSAYLKQNIYQVYEYVQTLYSQLMQEMMIRDGTRIQKSEPGPVPPSVGFDQYRPGFPRYWVSRVPGFPGSRVLGVTCTVCSTLVFERREWSSGGVSRRSEAGQDFILISLDG